LIEGAKSLILWTFVLNLLAELVVIELIFGLILHFYYLLAELELDGK
jgi:hypothetical protein